MMTTTRGKNPPRSKPLKPPFPRRALDPPPPTRRNEQPHQKHQTFAAKLMGERCLSFLHDTHTQPHTHKSRLPTGKKTYSFPRLSSRPTAIAATAIAATAAGLCDVKNDDMNKDRCRCRCCLPPTQPNPKPTTCLRPPTDRPNMPTYPPPHPSPMSLPPTGSKVLMHTLRLASLPNTKQSTHLSRRPSSFCIFNLDPSLSCL